MGRNPVVFRWVVLLLCHPEVEGTFVAYFMKLPAWSWSLARQDGLGTGFGFRRWIFFFFCVEFK